MTTKDLWVSPDGSRRLVANGRTLARLDQLADRGQWIDTCVLDAGDARALRALVDERSRLERERDEAVEALRKMVDDCDPRGEGPRGDCDAFDAARALLDLLESSRERSAL